MDHEKRDVFGWARGLWRDRRPMVIAALLLAIGLPVVIYLALSFKEESSPAVDKAINQAMAVTEDGDYADAYNKLKATESLAGTKEQKIELYSSLAAAAANAGKPQEAIDYLLRKHQLDPVQAGSDAYMLATLYIQVNDPVKAAGQYKAALAYYESLPKDEMVNAKIESVKAVIDELEPGDE